MKPVLPQDLMAKKIFTVRDVDNLFTARRLMSERRVRHVPVVNAADEIVGILSAKDVALGVEFPHIRVEHAMSTPIEYVTEQTPLTETIYRMLSKKISSLIVIDDQKEAVGIFTSDDLLLYLAHILEDESKRGSPWTDFFKLQTIGGVVNKVAAVLV